MVVATTTTTNLPWPLHHPPLLHSSQSQSQRLLQRPHQRQNSTIPRAFFSRTDFDGFAKRAASGELWRDAWRSANDGFEQLLFETKKTAERIDREYSVSRRLSAVAESAAGRARELDRDFEVTQGWRTFTLDFSRNWPKVCSFRALPLLSLTPFCLSIYLSLIMYSYVHFDAVSFAISSRIKLTFVFCQLALAQLASPGPSHARGQDLSPVAGVWIQPLGLWIIFEAHCRLTS